MNVGGNEQEIIKLCTARAARHAQRKPTAGSKAEQGARPGWLRGAYKILQAIIDLSDVGYLPFDTRFSMAPDI